MSNKDLRHDSEDKLLIPRYKTKLEENQIMVIAPYIWNSLPEDYKSQSYDAFKKNVKKLLLSSQV